MASFCAVFFPRDVLDKIWDLIGSVSEGSPSYYWVHYYASENKAQSRHRVGPGFLRPTKFKTQPSAGKVMATVFYFGTQKALLCWSFYPREVQ